MHSKTPSNIFYFMMQYPLENSPDLGYSTETFRVTAENPNTFDTTSPNLLDYAEELHKAYLPFSENKFGAEPKASTACLKFYGKGK